MLGIQSSPQNVHSPRSSSPSQHHRSPSPPHENTDKDGIVLTSPIPSPPPEDCFNPLPERSSSAPPVLPSQITSSPFQIMTPERPRSISPVVLKTVKPEFLKPALESESEFGLDSFKSMDETGSEFDSEAFKTACETESESASEPEPKSEPLKPGRELKLLTKLKLKLTQGNTVSRQGDAQPSVRFEKSIQVVPFKPAKKDEVPQLQSYSALQEAHNELYKWMDSIAEKSVAQLEGQGYTSPAAIGKLHEAANLYGLGDLKQVGDKTFTMLAKEEDKPEGALSPELTGWVREVELKLCRLQRVLDDNVELFQTHALPQPESLRGLVGWTKQYREELGKLPVDQERLQSLHKDEQEHLRWERQNELQKAQSNASTNNMDWKPEWYQKLQGAQANVDSLMVWMAGLDKPYKLPQDEKLLISPLRREAVRQQMQQAGQRYQELKIKENGDALLSALQPGAIQQNIEQQKLSALEQGLKTLDARLKVIISPRPDTVEAANKWVQYYRDKIAQVKPSNTNALPKTE